MLPLQLVLLLALLAWVIRSAAAQGSRPPARDLDAEARAMATAADSTATDASSATAVDSVPTDSLGVPLELARLDWAGMARFAKANQDLGPKPPGARRVVFMGNSITEGWAASYPEAFAQHPSWVNRGISGQTTEQMLVRFRQDVIALDADVVVIAAGINDIAANTGYTPPEETVGHLKSMCEIAGANGVRVVLESILPAYDFPWRPTMASPAQQVVHVNEQLAAFAKTQDHVDYLDLFSVLADERPGMRADMSYDEVHLTREGYATIAPHVEAAVAAALEKTGR